MTNPCFNKNGRPSKVLCSLHWLATSPEDWQSAFYRARGRNNAKAREILSFLGIEHKAYEDGIEFSPAAKHILRAALVKSE